MRLAPLKPMPKTPMPYVPVAAARSGADDFAGAVAARAAQQTAKKADDVIPLPAKNYTHTTYNNGSAITDGKYVTDPISMARHKPDASSLDKIDSKSLFKSGVDAEKTTLDAARYADKHGLWNNQGKAKVPTNDVVGYTDGKPTRIVNVYRKKPNKDGVSPIHGTPGKEH